MLLSPARPDVLALLYEQRRNYNAQLGQNHESLSKLYKKLATVERVLAKEQERNMTRANRKKHKWTQILTKENITLLQSRQDTLYEHLDQCVALIGSYHKQTILTSSTPGMHMPPSPHMFTPSTPFPYSPFAANFSCASSNGGSEMTFWDLSRLREPSPFSSMADSGYHEPLSLEPVDSEPSFEELDHIFSHGNLPPARSNVNSATSGDTSIVFKREELPDLRHSSSPTQSGAQKHQRCVSADFAHLVDGGLVAPPPSKRCTSVGSFANTWNDEASARVRVRFS